MNNFDEIINKPAFAGITEEQKDYYKELLTRLQGKNSMEAMLIMMEFSKKAPKGAPLSKQEQEMMIAAITEDLPQKDKDNFLHIIKIMNSLKKD